MIPSPWLIRSSIDPFGSNSPPENSVLVFLFVCLFVFVFVVVVVVVVFLLNYITKFYLIL